MTKQLKAMGIEVDQRKVYKTGGIVRLNENEEVLLVETAGPYLNDNPTKLSLDNSKGMFGLLAMMKTIADKYRYCSKDIFKQLKLLFLQPGNTTLRLWTFQYESNGIYKFERVAKAFTDENYCRKSLIELALFAVKLQELLQKTADTVQLIKEDHQQHNLGYESDMDGEGVCLVDIICPKIFKISFNKHSKGFGNQELKSPDNVFK